MRDYTQASVFILSFCTILLPMTGGDTLSIFYVSPTRHLKVEVYKKQKNDLINFSSPYNKMKFQMIISFSIGCLSHVDLSKEEYYITIFIQILYYLNYFMYNGKRNQAKGTELKKKIFPPLFVFQPVYLLKESTVRGEKQVN